MEKIKREVLQSVLQIKKCVCVYVCIVFWDGQERLETVW